MIIPYLEKQFNINMKKIILMIWLPISIVIGAIDVINMFENFWPSLIKWVSFFQIAFQLVTELRDFMLYPLAEMIRAIFGYEIPVGFRFYLFFGLIVFSGYSL